MIDWTKPLECDHGTVKVRQFGGEMNVSIDANDENVLTYAINKVTGVAIINFLDDKFTVRNKKTNRDRAIEILKKYFPKNQCIADCVVNAIETEAKMKKALAPLIDDETEVTDEIH